MKSFYIKIILVVIILTGLSYGSDKTNIVILSSYHQNLNWNDHEISGIRDEFEKELKNYELWIEYLDTKRFFNEEYLNSLERHLKLKYKNVNVDIILTTDNNALNLLIDRKLFNDTIPAVFCGYNDFTDDLLSKRKHLYGVKEEIDVKNNLEIIRKLNTEIKEIDVIGDQTTTGKAVIGEIKLKSKNFPIKLNYLNDFTFDELINYSKSKSNKDVILYTVFNRDRNGVYYDANIPLREMAKVSDVQIYSFWKFYFGDGIIGGKLVSGYEQGKAAAKIASKILHSKKLPENYAIESPNKYFFDYNVFSKYGFEQDDFPRYSKFINLPKSFIDKYILHLVISGSTILVIFLILILIRRNKKLNQLNRNIVIEKQKLQKVAEQLSKFSRAIEQSANSVVITDIDANIEYVNPKFEEITGYSLKEVIGKNPRILKSPDSPRQLYLEMWNKLINGLSWNGEFENIKKDGTVYWEYAHITPLKNSEGKTTNYLAIKEDITERKRKEKQFQQLNRLLDLKAKSNLALILAQSEQQLCEEQCNIFIYTGNYDVAWINFYDKPGNLKEMPPEYFSTRFDDITKYEITSDFENCIECPLNETLKEKKSTYIHYNEEIKKGNTCLIHKKGLRSVISLPINYEEKNYGVLMLYSKQKNRFDEEEIQAIYDITYVLAYGINFFRERESRAKIEKALERERKELQITMKNLSEGVLTVDKLGKITLANYSVYKIFGITYNLLNKHLKDISNIFDERTNQRFNEEISLLYSGEKKQFSLDHINIEVNGSSKIVTITGSVILDEKGKIRGIIFVIRDITDVVEIENQLALSQKMESIGQLAAGIAHEINTPLQFVNDNTTFLGDSFNSILEIIEMLKNTSDKNEKEKILEENDFEFLAEEIPQAISQSQEGLNRVSKIVRAMKDFAHSSNNEKSFADINKGLEVTATISKNEWKYVADLELNLNPDLPPVYCSLEEVNQVFLNMIVNAAHAIEEKLGEDPEEKGKIKISTDFDDNYAIIIIEDNGCGIKPEYLNRVFDPFFTTKEVGRGTGQGLAISIDIIQNRHNGKLLVDSEVSVGTKFTIKLPLNADE